MDAWVWQEAVGVEMMRLGLGPEESAEETLRAEARIERREAWVRAQIGALREAYRRCAAAWERLADADPDAEGPPAEQAEAERILAEIVAARDHDRWPRHLHWGDV